MGFGDEAAAEFVATIPPDSMHKSWQLITPNGSRLTHGRAAVEVFKSIPATSWLGEALEKLRLVGLVTLVYEIVSRNRSWLGRLVRDAPGPRRLP